MMMLADISVDGGDDAGSEQEVPTAWIAVKFIAYHSRQTTPFVPKAVEIKEAILLQNTGRQAAVVNSIVDARTSLRNSQNCDKGNCEIWIPLHRHSTLRNHASTRARQHPEHRWLQ
ncbi:hypothetical protein RISK_005362 [Rhodopirellula islandica]|uniref:Uncharacterized protein n=1 Tax=Rhodopirellula islandica TaxID=595434 RepID=A0A0J1B735_RHOIS|nr:hypothetical protein RISK_005362 [Rhodopirellula islandica]